MVNPASRPETPDSFELIDDASVQSEIDAHSQHATPEIPKFNRAPLALLYLNVLVIATCGLVYELLAGTLASYVLGDSVTQFSLIIGVYLSALGVGAWLSSFVKDNLARCFIEVELGVAVLGGAAALAARRPDAARADAPAARGRRRLPPRPPPMTSPPPPR